MDVVVILGLMWAAIIVPPAVRAHAARKEAFLVSFGAGPAPVYSPPRSSRPVQRRRRIAGGLLIAMAATLLVGLLPTFRALLVVHLFLVDLFLAYIGLLAHNAGRAARTQARLSAAAVRAEPGPIRVRVPSRWGRAPVRRPAVVSQGAVT